MKGREKGKDWVEDKLNCEAGPKSFGQPVGGSGVSSIYQRDCINPKWPGLAHSLDVGCFGKVTSDEVMVLQTLKELRARGCQLTPLPTAGSKPFLEWESE